MSSSRHLSPGAQLLKNSRLFSVPPPLPKPLTQVRTPNILQYRTSETATDPYPTRQAIVTPDASLKRGDWGLKRNLPVRQTTKASYPTIRINGLDTLEQITDYSSASDHVRTLEKFQEMALAVTREVARDRVAGSRVRGGFDNDTTQRPDISPGAAPRYEGKTRWKFQGPNLLSMSEGEFQRYLDKKLKNKTKEFEAYWKTAVEAAYKKLKIQNLTLDAANLATIREGISLADSSETEGTSQSTPINEEAWVLDRYREFLTGLTPILFEHYVAGVLTSQPSIATIARHVNERIPSHSFVLNLVSAIELSTSPADMLKREEIAVIGERLERIFIEDYAANHETDTTDMQFNWRKQVFSMSPGQSINRDLFQALLKFLDIPEPEVLTREHFTTNLRRTSNVTQATQHDEPLTTHPSAGLSYLRTNSVIVNHPVLGPQAQRTPVQGRVIRPREAPRAPGDTTTRGATAMIGVAGFVTQEPQGQAADEARYLNEKAYGGNKIWYQGVNASVNKEGKVMLHLRASSTEALSIHEGKFMRVEQERKEKKTREQEMEEAEAQELSPIEAPVERSNSGTPSQSSVAAMESILQRLKDAEQKDKNTTSYPTS